MQYSTPILFLIFNRPEVSFRVFERIREMQPAFLFIAADGPRPGRPGEAALCRQTRSVVERIDWPCTVKTLFRDENIGCARGVGTAITWFFEQVEQGIILEDDCLPDLTFFSFCEELLDKYKYDREVGAVSGFNIQLGIPRTRYSYYFARLHSCWGWATWADRWQKYNEITETPDPAVLNHPVIFEWKQEILDTFSGKKDSWAIRWQYVFQKNRFLCIYPAVSLIRNIGFSEEASNTREMPWWNRYIRYGKIDSIKHPPERNICEAADRLTIQLNMALPLSWKDRIKRVWYSWRDR